MCDLSNRFVVLMGSFPPMFLRKQSLYPHRSISEPTIDTISAETYRSEEAAHCGAELRKVFWYEVVPFPFAVAIRQLYLDLL